MNGQNVLSLSSSPRKQGLSWLRRSINLWVPAFAGMTMVGCTPASEPIEATGDEPTIVSLNPCTDAILAEVASPEQLLAISHYSHNPDAASMDIAQARQFATTGGTAEEVLALQPDIVVAGAFLPPATRQAFDDLGIQVETFGIASTIEDSDEQIRRLAEISGDRARGDTLIDRIDAALEHTRIIGDPISTVLWQPSGIVPGNGTLVSDLMRHTGFTNHSTARGMRQGDYLALEQMLVDPPEVLLLAGRERSQQHPALGRLARVHHAEFDTALLYCGGPTIIRAVERLSAIREEIQ